MLTALGGFGRRWAAQTVPWTNVYGLGRTFLALGTLTTLLFTDTAHFIVPAAGVDRVPLCLRATKMGLFCIAPSSHLEVARWVCVAMLLVVASGWRPCITGLLHWWVAFSFQNNAVVTDGGDQVTLVLATLLLPVALTDRRKWHWDPAPSDALPLRTSEELRRLVALVALTLVRVQVAAIYFHAAIAKFAVEQWGDGTALWYWAHEPLVGAAPWLRALLDPFLRNGITLTLITWGVLMLEYLLSAALVMQKKYWRWLLVAGLVFHGGIIVLHGLISFASAMFGALVLYLRPVELPFHLAPWRLRQRSVLGPRQAQDRPLLGAV
jgi:antimicrobial peptide system SdpB family protein